MEVQPASDRTIPRAKGRLPAQRTVYRVAALRAAFLPQQIFTIKEVMRVGALDTGAAERFLRWLVSERFIGAITDEQGERFFYIVEEDERK